MSIVNRRNFLQSTALGLTALSAGRVLGANQRIGVGLIGFGLIGRFHLAALKEQPDVQVTAVCDVHRGRVAAAAEMAGGNAAQYGDFRKLLDDKHVNAVYVATPDHWHALMTMLACAAGKDVYVEKPLTLFVRKGRWMLDVARRSKRVVQVGTQNRSGPPFQRARELIRQGKLGQIVSATNNNSRNVMPGFGNPPDGARRRSWTTTCSWGPPRSGLTIPTVPSITSAGSGTTPAGRRPTWASTRWTSCTGCWA